MSTDTIEDEAVSLDGTLVPIEIVRTYYGVSRVTLWRWLQADNIDTHGDGRDKAVKWTDLPPPSTDTTRWHRHSG